MTPLAIIGLASAAITLLNEAIPEIKRMTAGGEISPEDQQKVLDEFNALKTRTGSIFEGLDQTPSGR